MKTSRPSFVILTLFIIGICLRLFSLNTQTLWMDEASVFFEAFGHSISETWVLRHRLQPQNAPLYPLIISALGSLIDVKNFISFRVVSVFFGGLGLLSIYFFSKEYLKDQRKTMMFFLIMAISSFHIQFSQLIRFYILLFLFFYLHLFVSLRWFETKKNLYLIFIFLFSTLGCWTNQLMALSFLISSLMFIFTYGFNFKRLLVFNSLNVLGFMTYLPSYLLYLNGKFKIGSYRSLVFGDFLYMLKTVFFPKHLGPSLLELRYFNHNKFNVSAIFEAISGRVEFEIIGLFCFAFLWIFMCVKFFKLDKEKYIFLGCLGFFCCYLYYKNVPFNDRYFLIFYPLFILLLIKNLDIFGSHQNKVFYLILAFNSWSTFNYFFDPRHHTLNVNKIISRLENKNNNYISLESSKLFTRYFKRELNGKRLSIVENLVDRSLFGSYLPTFFNKKDEFTFIFTHRSVLTEKLLKDIFNKINKTHHITEPEKNIDPYFRIYKAQRKK